MFNKRINSTEDARIAGLLEIDYLIKRHGNIPPKQVNSLKDLGNITQLPTERQIKFYNKFKPSEEYTRGMNLLEKLEYNNPIINVNLSKSII